MFERIFDGLQTISKGDVIRLNTKPSILGRVRVVLSLSCKHLLSLAHTGFCDYMQADLWQVVCNCTACCNRPGASGHIQQHVLCFNCRWSTSASPRWCSQKAATAVAG